MFMGQSLLRRRRGHRQIASFLVGAALLIAGCSIVATPSTQTASALKPIDQAALQSLVDRTIKELLIPGAVVLLRTPQGDFTAASGTTQLGTTSPPALRHPLPDRLEHQDDDGRGDPPTCSGRQAESQRSGVEVRPRRAQRRQHHHRRAVGDAQRSLQLHQRPRARDEHRPSADEDLDPAGTAGHGVRAPPTFPPGTAYEYCNTNYALLGLIIEKVDGRPLATAMQKRLFEPLGMQNTVLPASTSNSIPEPYSHGYLYGSSSVALYGTPPYSPAEKAAARAGTLQPTDYTGVNHSFAAAAGGVISTANDLAAWMQALVGGRVLNAEYQRVWLDSVQPEVPSKSDSQRYGYGIAQVRWGPNTMKFHGGETPGYNSFMGTDATNKMTLVVWTNLTVSLDDSPTANTLMLKVLDQIYVVSPLPPPPSPTATP